MLATNSRFSLLERPRSRKQRSPKTGNPREIELSSAVGLPERRTVSILLLTLTIPQEDRQEEVTFGVFEVSSRVEDV